MRLRSLLGRSLPLVLALNTSTPSAGTAPTDSAVVRIGYFANTLLEVSLSDARAATQVWANRILKETTETAETRVMIISDLASLVLAIESAEIDIITLLPLEYLAVKHRTGLQPAFVGVRRGRCTEQYLLLVRKDSGVTGVSDLRGRGLLAATVVKSDIPLMWLSSFLAENGLPDCPTFFGRISRKARTSQAALPVFFGQEEACFVARSYYKTLTELNPQIDQELEPLAVSPGFCQGIVCFREGFKGVLADQIRNVLSSLHTRPHGQQLLALFQTDRLIPFKPEHLEETLRVAGKIDEQGPGRKPAD